MYEMLFDNELVFLMIALILSMAVKSFQRNIVYIRSMSQVTLFCLFYFCHSQNSANDAWIHIVSPNPLDNVVVVRVIMYRAFWMLLRMSEMVSMWESNQNSRCTEVEERTS